MKADLPKSNNNIENFQWIKNYLNSGDKKYLGYIFEKYKQQLFIFIFKILKNYEDAKDLTSEAFIKAFEKIHDFDLNKPFYPWLSKIALNLCIDQIRRKKHIQFEQIENQSNLTKSENTGEDIEKKEQMTIILNLIHKLRRKQRRCFCLFYFHEKSYHEIANITDYPLNEVRSHIQNGRRRIIAMMQKKVKQV